MCTGVEGPNGVFTNIRSRSSNRAPEAKRRRRRLPPLTRFKNGDLYVHMAYEGWLLHCCYVSKLMSLDSMRAVHMTFTRAIPRGT